MLNKAILMGRLTRNPELRYTPSNTPVVSFTLAIDRGGRKDAAGNKQTDFIDCVAWSRTAEFMNQWFTKGMLAIVVGRIQSRNWEDKNGSKRVSIEVVCDEVSFGETKKSREENGYGGYAPQGGSQGNYRGNAPAAPTFDLPTGSDGFSELSDDDGGINAFPDDDDEGDVPF